MPTRLTTRSRISPKPSSKGVRSAVKSPTVILSPQIRASVSQGKSTGKNNNGQKPTNLETLEKSGRLSFDLGTISLTAPPPSSPNTQPPHSTLQANQISPLGSPFKFKHNLGNEPSLNLKLDEDLLTHYLPKTMTGKSRENLGNDTLDQNPIQTLPEIGKTPLQIQRWNPIKSAKKWAKKAFDWVKEKVVKPIEKAAKKLLEGLKSQGRNLINKIKAGAKGLINQGKKQIKNLINKIKKQITTIINKAKKLAQGIIKQAQKQAQKWVNKAKKAAQKVLNFVRERVQKYSKKMLDLAQYFIKIGNPKKAQDLIKNIREFADKKMNQAREKITALSQKVTAQITQLMEKTIGKVTQKLQNTIGQVQGWIQKLSNGANEKLNQANQGVQKSAQKITQAIPQLFQKIKNKLNGILGPARGVANWLIDKLTNLADSILSNTLMPLVKQATAGMQKLLQPLVNLARSLLKQGTSAIMKGLQTFAGKINQMSQTFTQKAKRWLEEILQKVAGSIIQMMTQIVGGIVNRIVGLIEQYILEPLKVFFDFMEILSQVLASAAGVIDKILAHPVDFIKNLFAGVQQGLSAFLQRLGHHLEQGLKTYLLGPIAKMGVELPKSFDLKGIFSVVAQVAGISYKNIRQKAVGKLGEDKVTFLEQGAEAAQQGKLGEFAQNQAQGYAEGLKEKAGPAKEFIALFAALRQGVGGIVDYFKQLDVGSLVKMVLDGIKDYLMEQVIQKAIIQVMAYLVPGAGWLKAAIDALRVMYALFIKRAEQVKEIVQGFSQSVVDVAQKAVSQAATRLEGVLGNAVPVLIGVLADYLGISGLPEKIQGFIGKGQDWINDNVMPMVDRIMDSVSGILAQVPGTQSQENNVIARKPVNRGYSSYIQTKPNNFAKLTVKPTQSTSSLRRKRNIR